MCLTRRSDLVILLKRYRLLILELSHKTDSSYVQFFSDVIKWMASLVFSLDESSVLTYGFTRRMLPIGPTYLIAKPCQSGDLSNG